MDANYDVIVIGGGPAGSVCARFLGMSGAKVLLIDKATFPRDKICGDAISPRVCDQMKKIGLYHLLDLVPTGKVGNLLFSHPDVKNIYLKTVQNTDHEGYVCKREDFDNILFQEAKKYVDVLEGTKVKKLVMENGKAVGIETEDRIFKAKVIVGADGANGITAKTLRADKLDENHNAVAIRSYYTNVKGMNNSIELYFLKELQPGYFWIFPLNPVTGEANVGLGVLSNKVRNKNLQLKKILNNIVTHDPEFRDRFLDAKCTSPVKGWSLPLGSKMRQTSFEGALLVGDAAGLIDPITGEGLENAFKSGIEAAKIIKKALKQKDYSKSFLQQYEDELIKLLGTELKYSYYIQKMMRNPLIMKLSFQLLKRSKIFRKAVAKKFFN